MPDRLMGTRVATGWLLAAAILAAGCRGDDAAGPEGLDARVRAALAGAGVQSVTPPPAPPAPLVALGQALMFDKILSGNLDVSCATCHHPAAHTGDGLSLAIGTGGAGAIPNRTPGSGRPFIPRNSLDLFNRGFPPFRTVFWDGRVSQSPSGDFTTPAGGILPGGLASAVAAQALFPVLSRDEMRGQVGDLDVQGNANTLAQIPDTDPGQVWQALMQRVVAIPGYVTLLQAAYPGVPANQLGFQHAANAIAAFITATWTSVDAPLDRYLAGDDGALTVAQKQGALLFYGKAGCGPCHAGPFQTDHLFHNIGIPQLGPGRGSSVPLDFGRELVTGNPADRYRFRTPPLRNVELTAPYMHNGAYTTLTAAVRHYINVPQSIRGYDAGQLRPDLQGTVVTSVAVQDELIASLDRRVQAPLPLSDGDVADLVAFLRALTDPSARNQLAQVPTSVPSGLPID